MGGRGPSLELTEAFDAGAEVPHPLSEPRVVGISMVGRDCRATQVEGILNRGVELGNKTVELLGGHGRRDKDVSRQEGTRKYAPLCPVPSACRRHRFEAEVKIEKYGVVVRSIESGVNPPGGNGAMEAASKSHIDAGVPEGRLERRSVTDVLNV